jgi:hypothetical protein
LFTSTGQCFFGWRSELRLTAAFTKNLHLSRGGLGLLSPHFRTHYNCARRVIPDGMFSALTLFQLGLSFCYLNTTRLSSHSASSCITISEHSGTQHNRTLSFLMRRSLIRQSHMSFQYHNTSNVHHLSCRFSFSANCIVPR